MNGARVRGDRRVRAGDTVTVSGLGPAGTEKTGGRGAPAPGGGPPPRRNAKRRKPARPPRRYGLSFSGKTMIFSFSDKPRGALVHGSGGLDGPVRRYLLPRLPPSLAFAPGPFTALTAIPRESFFSPSP